MDSFAVMEAVSFAARAHIGQTRKDGETPYFSHPVRVMTILATVFDVRRPEILITALLHDTIEDTHVDRDRITRCFGEQIGAYVALLSKDQRLSEHEREQDYLDVLAAAPIEVQLCKLADVLDNIMDSKQLSTASRRKTLMRARTLVNRLKPGFPQQWAHAIQCVTDALDQLEIEIGGNELAPDQRPEDA